jgi:23S rRNA pseudouridine2605 synthase
VQVDRIPDAELLRRLADGATVEGEKLSAKTVSLLRSGGKNAWLDMVLDEGRNRQIRRLLEVFDIAVLRLIRVAIGNVELGTLPKGGWRALSAHEVDALVPRNDVVGRAPTASSGNV